MVDARRSLRLHLVSDRVAVMTRQFRAPRELLFRAVSEPADIEQWWGPDGHRATVLEQDFRVGGRWRFHTRDEQGRVHPFTGEYQEIVPQVRVVQTFTYDVGPFASAQSIETLTLESFGDDTTTMTNISSYPTPELMDVMLEWGLEEGLAEAYDRLQRYLDTLGQTPSAVISADSNP